MEIFKNATKVAVVCLKNKNMYVLSMGLPFALYFQKSYMSTSWTMYVVDKMNSPVMFIQNHSVEN